MNRERKKQPSFSISQKDLLALVRRAMTGGDVGREADDQPLPRGPWDPVVRVALERVGVHRPHPHPWKVVLAAILAKHPEIWDVIGGDGRLGDEVALNPQPLPPRFAFLAGVAQAVVSRAELMQEVGDALSPEGEQRGIIVIGGYIGRFVDDWCGTPWPRWPFPWPPPPWYDREMDSMDLLVLAAEFEQAAYEVVNPHLRQNLLGASAKFAEVGLSRM